MKSVLHIISSARGEQSYSKKLSSAIVQELKDRNVVRKVVEKDLTKERPPFFNPESIDEFYKMPLEIDKAANPIRGYSESVFHEVQEADILVIGTPVHNFGISAPLKAWIDQLIRPGVTYTFDTEGKKIGLLRNKKLYLAIASGGAANKGKKGEYLETYIKAVFSEYAGITDVTTVRVEGTVGSNFDVDYRKIVEKI